MPSKLAFFLLAFVAILCAQSNYEILLSRPDIDGLSSDDNDGTDLDDIATTGLAIGAMVTVYDGSQTRIYRLTAGTDAENSPTIIRPDDFADPANAKVWKARMSSKPEEISGSETDPIFSAAPASGITASDTVRWNGVFGTAASAIVVTPETKTSPGTYDDLTTVGPSVTVNITSGKALVMVYSYIQPGGGGGSGYVSFSATGVAANDSRAIFHYGDSEAGRIGATFLVTGATNGSNTFTLKYKTSSAFTIFKDREIIVIPLP